MNTLKGIATVFFLFYEYDCETSRTVSSAPIKSWETMGRVLSRFEVYYAPSTRIPEYGYGLGNRRLVVRQRSRCF